MSFNFREPNYIPVFAARVERLKWLRAQEIVSTKKRAKEAALRLAAMRVYYRANPWDFINDWGVTFDPKLIERGLPSLTPFLLFPKQREWVEAVVEQWRAGSPMITEKTRQMGFSWLAMATACTLCIFNDGMAIGFGSRKEEYVDKLGDPKSLFHKAREFMRYLPVEFQAGWKSAHMRMTFNNGASIAGEAGDNIGRGATTSIYFVDESAFLERPQLVDASLSQTTNCRIDISTPNGMANTFYEKRFSGRIRVFTFHWRDDPRKDQAWYDKQVAELDPVTVAQEIDIDYAASVEGVLIPSAWVQAAVDLDVRLGITVTGEKRGAFDVADEGKDKLAWASGRGILIDRIEEWSGVGSDTFRSTEKVFGIADEEGITDWLYDADGMGALVRGDARVINERREALRQPTHSVVAFRGSAGVFKPEAQDVKGRKNQDYFANAKAQEWSSLRTRFMKAHRVVNEGMTYPIDELISIRSTMPLRGKLCSELSQPTWKPNLVGKMVVDKMPDGVRSPNLADAVMMRFSRFRAPMRISQAALESA